MSMLNIKNTTDGYLKDVEIKGNTVQDAENLADIRSVGDKVEGQELYEIPVVSCGKNLFDGNYEEGYISLGANTAGQLIPSVNYRSTEFIKVKQNTTYTMRYINRSATTFYDKNKVKVGESNSITFTTNENTHYVRIYYYHPDSSEVENKDNFQLEEGTRATPYEPYQEDKLTILSPVQLENGDILKEVGGVWGVEKHMKTVLVDGVVVKSYSVSTALQHNVISVELSDMLHLGWEAKHQERYYCDRLANGVDKPDGNWHESVGKIMAHSRGVWLSCDTSITTVVEADNYLKNNNHLIKYPTTQPQFIPLPHSQQLKLRTFAGQTNIHFETEIEGIIKAQVPKSLGATINTHTEQIGNLSKELDRVKKLEESTVSTVTTESDFTTVEETANGILRM